MVITLQPALCRPLLTGSVQTASLITNNVKKTDRALVRKPDMSIPVLPDGFMPLQTVANGILLTEPAVPVQLLPVVPATMP